MERFTKARQALRKLLDGPVWLRPTENGGYVLEGKTRVGTLLALGILPHTPPIGVEPRAGSRSSIKLASPRRFERCAGSLTLAFNSSINEITPYNSTR